MTSHSWSQPEVLYPNNSITPLTSPEINENMNREEQQRPNFSLKWAKLGKI